MMATMLAAAQKTYTRDEFRIRDPFVLPDGGVYYLYESQPWFGGDGVFVRTSRDLENWSEKERVMKVPEGVKATAFWAPEVHKHNGAYYLFVTLTEDRAARPVAPVDPAHAKMAAPRGTWIFKASSPKGPFLPVKMGPVPPADWMTLDGTLYVENGQPYMVFCREWIQVGDGQMCYAPLTDDFAAFTEKPVTFFEASKTMAGAHWVTDGPFFHTSEKGRTLFMIWSNMVKGHGYCVLYRKSESGTLAGPWTKDAILFGKNGGHGMIFKAFDGRVMLTLHQPNSGTAERMKLFTLTDTGTDLVLSDK